MKMQEIEKIASEVLFHKKLFYAGKSEIDNDTYDALEEKLRQANPKHPVLDFVGYPLESGGDKIEHSPPMLSLAKTYDVAELIRFLQKFPEDIICMDKYDGMAMSLEYDAQGKLFRASSRGNGQFGENVTEHIFHVTRIPKHIHFPKEFVGKVKKLEVRGEVFFPKSAFLNFVDDFDSFRNAVPGTFGRKDVESAKPVLNALDFVVYGHVFHSENGPIPSDETLSFFPCETRSRVLHWLEQQGFYTGLKDGFVQVLKETQLADALAARKHLDDWYSKDRDHEIDGVVFRVDNELNWEEMGSTAHHPRGSIAFKQTGDIAETSIEDIDIGVGRSGKISFRARLKPVKLSGAKISYATLHNAEFIERGNYAPGAVVTLKRSGEVIPAILGLVTPPSQSYSLPENCLCGSSLTRIGPDLFCLQNPTCEFRDHEGLIYFVKSLEIKGISDKILQKLKAAGLLRSPESLFALQFEEVAKLEGLGKKSAENILAAIEGKRNISLAAFLTSLGLKRGGKVKCREVAQRCGSLNRVLALSPKELSAWKGWAEKSAQDFLESLHQKRQLVDKLLKYMKVAEQDVQEDSLGEGKLAGTKICVTGKFSKPRKEYEQAIVAAGGQLTSTVSKETNYLVCNEASTSSKYKKALSLGTPIINEEQLVSLLE